MVLELGNAGDLTLLVLGMSELEAEEDIKEEGVVLGEGEEMGSTGEELRASFLEEFEIGENSGELISRILSRDGDWVARVVLTEGGVEICGKVDVGGRVGEGVGEGRVVEGMVEGDRMGGVGKRGDGFWTSIFDWFWKEG